MVSWLRSANLKTMLHILLRSFCSLPFFSNMPYSDLATRRSLCGYKVGRWKKRKFNVCSCDLSFFLLILWIWYNFETFLERNWIILHHFIMCNYFRDKTSTTAHFDFTKWSYTYHISVQYLRVESKCPQFSSIIKDISTTFVTAFEKKKTGEMFALIFCFTK